MEPWEHESFDSRNYYTTRFSSRYGILHPNGCKEYKTRYETVSDSEKLVTRKGDIVKFGSGYHKQLHFGDWKDWFLTSKNDKKKFWSRDPRIPKYADHQYALIVNRYRWIKFKYKSDTFIDYGKILMFITGDKLCKIRRYYATAPYKTLYSFPHVHRDGNIYVKMKKPFKVIDKTWFLFDFNLSEFITKLLSKIQKNLETCFLRK
jgi:hypothetical protein